MKRDDFIKGREAVSRVYTELISERTAHTKSLSAKVEMPKKVSARLSIATTLIREGRLEEARGNVMMAQEFAAQEFELRQAGDSGSAYMAGLFKELLSAFVERDMALMRYDHEGLSNPFRGGCGMHFPTGHNGPPEDFGEDMGDGDERIPE